MHARLAIAALAVAALVPLAAPAQVRAGIGGDYVFDGDGIFELTLSVEGRLARRRIGARVEKQLDDLFAADLCRLVQRGGPFRLLDAHVRAARDEKLRHLFLAGEQRDLKRGVEELCVRAAVDRGATVEQELRDVDVSREGGEMQWRPPEAAFRGEIAGVRVQLFRSSCNVADGRRLEAVQRRSAAKDLRQHGVLRRRNERLAA